MKENRAYELIDRPGAQNESGRISPQLPPTVLYVSLIETKLTL
jgi:hypothetical protein